jgi:glycosidase
MAGAPLQRWRIYRACKKVKTQPQIPHAIIEQGAGSGREDRMARFWTAGLAAALGFSALSVADSDAAPRKAPKIPAAQTQAMNALGLAVNDPARLPQDEVVYFLLPDRFANGDKRNDRGGLRGDRMITGFDPTDPGFYQGGDLKGLTNRLDYIQGLGATAIWLGPIYKNDPVQGTGKDASAGYHGYWISDFLSVDPHFGTRADMKRFVDAAHARGMKVYLDIILNHTADVISYRECPHDQPEGAVKVACAYRGIADYPWTRQGGVAGAPINDGFTGDDEATTENFARLKNPNWAYTPYIPMGEENAKNPPWLNDILRYHNRGDTTFKGEDSLYGDFNGLDDLNTQDPVVVNGMIEIFKQWITDYRIDGFRIDTIKHARPELWEKFIPAIAAHAKAEGIVNFHMFGEAYDFNPAALARFTRQFHMPNVLDFAFQGTVRDIVIEGRATRAFERLFDADHIYRDGRATAEQNPTFLSNHDMGRFAGFLRQKYPEMPDAERLQRIKLANAMMFFTRGAPVIYSGDEQGFNSDGNDKQARETLFASQVASWNDNDLVGTDRTNALDNFNTAHPLYQAIAEMARVRAAHPLLRRGEFVLRHTDEEGGLLVLSRLDRAAGVEYVIAFNADTKPRTENVLVQTSSSAWTSISGACGATSQAPGSLKLDMAPLSYSICRSAP